MVLSRVSPELRIVLVVLGKTQTRNLQKRTQGLLVILVKIRTLLYTVEQPFLVLYHLSDFLNDDFVLVNEYHCFSKTWYVHWDIIIRDFLMIEFAR